MPWWSKPIAPCDFPDRVVALTVAKDSNGVEDYSQVSDGSCISYGDGTNVGLLWSRYMLARYSFDELDAHRRQRDGDHRFKNWRCLNLPGSQKDDRESAETTWSNSLALDHFIRSVAHIQPEPDLPVLRARRTATLQRLGDPTTVTVKNVWRAAVGLGNAATFENSGTALHATYGFPVLPAASLKGIARHYLDEDPGLNLIGTGQFDSDELDKIRSVNGLGELLFGQQEHTDDDHPAVVRIHDGWPVAFPQGGWFESDVLTVHHREYYGKEKDHGFAVDSEPPNPVHFLTLRPDVSFAIPIGLTGYGAKTKRLPPASYLKLTGAILTAALEHLGIGAKTASGYGRMMVTA